MVGAQESSRERRPESVRQFAWMKLLCRETELHMADAGDRDEPELIRGPMNEILRNEIWRKLDSLPDEKAYQVLDFINYLRSQYGEDEARASGIQKLGEMFQDTMRKRRVPATAIRETMKVMGAADRVLGTIRAAGKEFLVELEGSSRPEPSAPTRKNGSGGPPQSREISIE